MSDVHDRLPEGAEPPPAGVRTMGLVRWALVGLMAVAALVSVVDYARVTGGHETLASAQYYCPMHPAIVQEHPGDCPICGMTLVRRDADAAAAEAPTGPGTVPGLATVSLPADRVQRIGIRTAAVRRGPVASTVRTVGYVTAAEDRMATIHPRFSGWIERLTVSQIGRTVRRGEVLATIYSPELLTAQQEYLNARRWAREGGDQHRLTVGLTGDARHRLRLLGIADEEISQLDRSGRVSAALPVRAAVAGVVVSKAAVQGTYVEPSTALFEIADLAAVWVTADVYERDLAAVRAGMTGRLTLVAFPGEAWLGRVDFVPPTVAAETRTARVRFVFANPDGRLRPGSYGDITLDVPSTEAVLVPAEAVVDTGDWQYVFVAHADGRFEPRRVHLGAKSGQDIVVSDGIAEGDRVVTTANFLIDSESRLRAAIAGSGNPEPPNHAH